MREIASMPFGAVKFFGNYSRRDPDSESGPRRPRRILRRNGSPPQDASARRPYLNSYIF